MPQSQEILKERYQLQSQLGNGSLECWLCVWLFVDVFGDCLY
jgi:hypothetical protein